MEKIPMVQAMAQQEIERGEKFTGTHWRREFRKWLKTKDGRKHIREVIEEVEYNANGFGRLSGVYVQVRNIRVQQKDIRADVILTHDAETGHKERFDGCRYNINKLFNLENPQ